MRRIYLELTWKGYQDIPDIFDEKTAVSIAKEQAADEISYYVIDEEDAFVVTEIECLNSE